MDGFDVPYAGQQVFLKVGRPGSVGEHDALAWGAVSALVSEGGFTDLWNVCVSSSLPAESSPTLADGGYQTLSEDEDGLEGLACCYLVCQVVSVVRLRGEVRALVSVPGREPGAPLIAVSLSDLVAFDSTGVESSDAAGPFPPQSPSAFPPQASPGCTLLASYGATSQLGSLYVPVRLLTVERRAASASAVAQVSLRNLRFQLLRTVSVQHLPSGAAICCPAPDADSNSTIATTASLEEGRCCLAVAHRAVPGQDPEYLKCLGSSLRGEAQQLLTTFQQLSSMPRAALDGLEEVDDLSLLGVAAPGGRSTATSFFDGSVMTEAAGEGDVTFSFVARLARHSALAAAAVASCSSPEGQFALEQPLLTAIRALHCLLAYPLLSVGEWEAGLWAVGRLLTAVCSGDEPVTNRFPGLLDDVAAALCDYQECCCEGWLRIVEGWMLGDASVIDAKARAQRESRRGSGSDKDGVAAGVVAVGTQVLTLARVLSRTSEFWPPQKKGTGDHHLDRRWLRQLGLRVLTTALGSAIAELHSPLRDQSVAVASSPGTRADLLALAAIFKDAFLLLPLAPVDGASAAETVIDDRQSLVLADADAEGPPPDQNQYKGKERASEEEFLVLLTRCIESSCPGYKKPASRGAVLAQVPPLPAAAASVGALSEFSRVAALRESELLNWLTSHSVLS